STCEILIATIETAIRCMFLSFFLTPASSAELYTLSLHDALPIWIAGVYPSLPGQSRMDITIRWQSVAWEQPWFNPQGPVRRPARSEEHTSELQSRENLVCRLLLDKKKNTNGT